MKKLRFVRDVFQSGHPVFKSGQEVEPRPDLAKHVRRGAALEVEVADPKPAPKAEPEKPKGK